MMSRCSRVWSSLQVAALLWIAAGCGELSVTAVEIAEIEVLPDSTSVVVGLSSKLEVRLRDAAGNLLTDRDVVWSTSDPAVVITDDEGRITGLAPGTAQVYAQSGDLTGSARVQVLPAGRIVVEPDRVSLNANFGSTDVISQPVAVSNDGSGQLAGLSTTIAYDAADPGGWLSATLQTTTAPTTLLLSASASALAVGTYRATTTVATSTAGTEAVAIPVELVVAVPPPRIELEPPTVSFAMAERSADPAPQLVTVRNSGGGSLTGLSTRVSFAPGEPADWLLATLSSTTAPSTLALAVSGSHLTHGSYSATVFVESPAAENSPRALAVAVIVSEALPEIRLSETNRLFTAVAGGADPGAHAVTVSNDGGGTLDGLATTVTYASGQPQGWLAADLSGPTAPATLTLQPRVGTLAGGTYTARVTVSSNVASNSPQVIDVTFVVSASNPPAIALSKSEVAFTATAGGASPAAESIDVSNSGGGTLSGLSATTKYAAGQPTGWLTATLGATTAPTQLTLQAATGALAAGTYQATVEVAAAGASNSPRAVAVTFDVSPGTPPAAPTNLQAKESGRTSINLKWVDNSDNESNFEVQRSNVLGLTWTTVATLPAETIQHEDTGLERNTTYWYRVRACNAAGCSGWSNVDSDRTKN